MERYHTILAEINQNSGQNQALLCFYQIMFKLAIENQGEQNMGHLSRLSRRRSRYNNIASNAICYKHDDNEKFILTKVLVYLYSIIEKHFIIDEETIEMVSWGLEKDNAVIVDFLLNCIVKCNPKKQNRNVEDSFRQSTDGDIPRDKFGQPDIMELLERTDSKYFKGFKTLLLNTIDKKINSFKNRAKGELEHNIEFLQKMFNLNAVETELCTFLFINEICEDWRDYFISHLKCNEYSGKKYLISILGDDCKSIYEVLHGSLKKSAILDFDSYYGSSSFSIEDNIVSWLQYPADKLFSRGLYQSVQKSSTPLDYHFAAPEIVNHILNLLNYQAESSNHILLYGVPGSGKSSFARGLAEQLDCPAFEILRGGDDDEDNKSSSRQTAIRACINMNINNKPLIIVDEADNLLNTQSAWTSRGETQDKGWLNDLLDEPNLKFIWITNSIDGIETSVMRRFAYSIHFKPFNRKQRIQVWENILQRYEVSNLINHKNIEELARRYDVSAGAVDLAVKKALEGAALKNDDDEISDEKRDKFINSIQLTLNAHQTLLNHGEPIKDKNNIDADYSLEGLNIEGNFNQVMVTIKKFDEYLKSGRKGSVNNLNILFYGQSGTGKSELAKYIADTIDRSIVYKSISDIQSKWVGDTEKNIRSAFEEAEQEEAVLVFDEADSMLFNREKAQRSWEVSFTNEFLNQMERFRGILICTTNLLSEMDSASMRRFSHKIGLKYLTGDGNIVFYNKMIAPLIADKLDSKNENLLRKHTTLAAGDFKVVRNNFAFYLPEELTHDECIKALIEEAGHKKRYADGEKIGFLKK